MSLPPLSFVPESFTTMWLSPSAEGEPSLSSVPLSTWSLCLRDSGVVAPSATGRHCPVLSQADDIDSSPFWQQIWTLDLLGGAVRPSRSFGGVKRLDAFTEIAQELVNAGGMAGVHGEVDAGRRGLFVEIPALGNQCICECKYVMT